MATPVKGKAGKIPPAVWIGAAAAGVAGYLWWRNRTAASSASSQGTTNTATAGLASVGLPSTTDLTTAAGSVTTPSGPTGPTPIAGKPVTAPPPPPHRPRVAGIRKAAKQGAFSPVSISLAPALGGTSVGGGGPVTLGPYPGTSGPNTVIPTLGTGGAWSIFNQGGGTGAARAWAVSLLKRIGAPTSPGNVKFVYDWQVAEGAGGANNPLNQGPVPGQPGLTNTGQQFGGGAAGFVSRPAGLKGAAAYLQMPAYQGILSALRANQPTQARAALIASPWAASHYGGNLPNTAPPPPPKPPRAALPAVTTNPGATFPRVGPPRKPPARKPSGTSLQRALRRPAGKPITIPFLRTAAYTAAPRYRPRPARWHPMTAARNPYGRGSLTGRR